MFRNRFYYIWSYDMNEQRWGFGALSAWSSGTLLQVTWNIKNKVEDSLSWGRKQILNKFFLIFCIQLLQLRIIKWSELLWLLDLFVCLGLFVLLFLKYKFNGNSGTCLATKSSEDFRNASWNWEMYLTIAAQPLLSCLSGVPDSVQAP